jgi:hypothetical protein
METAQLRLRSGHGFSFRSFNWAWVLLLLLIPALQGFSADTLAWNTNKSLVTADISNSRLFDVLEKVARSARWHVFVEPDTDRKVASKFKDVAPGEALRLLLGELNYALVPGVSNSVSHLYVFRTSRQNATHEIQPAKVVEKSEGGKPIPNELIVRLKPGAKIDELAKLLGAKVTGKIDGFNAYRLQFDDQATADAAKEKLASNSDVASVDENYSVDRPNSPRSLQSSSVPPPQLQLKPPTDNNRVVVGLVDTAVQPLGNNLDQFLLKQVSVAGESQLDPNSPSHGTSMAETVLRSIQNMTKGSTSVQILPVDVYGPNETTSTFDVANGIAQAVNGGAKIINLSLGSQSDSGFLHSVIQDTSKLNIPIFAAAGNEPVTTPFYPAAYPEVGGVTAIDQGQLASYANRGSIITLGAPGTSIVYYNNQPYYVVGTSASSAFVSGIAAGYMDANHSSASQMQTFIHNNFGIKIMSGGK